MSTFFFPPESCNFPNELVRPESWHSLLVFLGSLLDKQKMSYNTVFHWNCPESWETSSWTLDLPLAHWQNQLFFSLQGRIMAISWESGTEFHGCVFPIICGRIGACEVRDFQVGARQSRKAVLTLILWKKLMCIWEKKKVIWREFWICHTCENADESFAEGFRRSLQDWETLCGRHLPWRQAPWKLSTDSLFAHGIIPEDLLDQQQWLPFSSEWWRGGGSKVSSCRWVLRLFTQPQVSCLNGQRGPRQELVIERSERSGPMAHPIVQLPRLFRIWVKKYYGRCCGSIEISIEPTWGCWWHHFFACPHWESYRWSLRVGWAGAEHHSKWWTTNRTTPYRLSHTSMGCFMYKGDCTCSSLFRKMIVFPCGNPYEATRIL